MGKKNTAQLPKACEAFLKKHNLNAEDVTPELIESAPRGREGARILINRALQGPIPDQVVAADAADAAADAAEEDAADADAVEEDSPAAAAEDPAATEGQGPARGR